MVQLLFILGDGDQIRARVEAYLLGGDLVGLSAFSRAVRTAIDEAATLAETELAAKTVMAAGDDLLLAVPATKYERARLEETASRFHRACGSTISFGVGPTVEEAFLALRKAKTQRGGVVVERGLGHE